ncbi:uncharacterized protein LTR77_002298 [Saxophila tyrrhenica]|uniref:BTB domain-containing protein n=1 Tax=Saxophila tyrrhenica TaxID=1690608 RepID=A0AAV9PI42_9PEZI|nr:hypothetical protein LTR77_002298 [Saxophila tyrrhenica]
MPCMPTTSEIIQDGYRTGEHSDLTIQSSDGRLFKVHQMVLEKKCPHLMWRCADFGKVQKHMLLNETGDEISKFLDEVYEMPSRWRSERMLQRTTQDMNDFTVDDRASVDVAMADGGDYGKGIAEDKTVEDGEKSTDPFDEMGKGFTQEALARWYSRPRERTKKWKGVLSKS